MNMAELDILMKKINRWGEDLCGKKNKDYSTDLDVHTNFKTMATLCGILAIDVKTPRGCMQYEIIKKVYRIFKLVNSGMPPENESLFDSAVDANVYIALLLGLGVTK